MIPRWLQHVARHLHSGGIGGVSCSFFPVLRKDISFLERLQQGEKFAVGTTPNLLHVIALTCHRSCRTLRREGLTHLHGSNMARSGDGLILLVR